MSILITSKDVTLEEEGEIIQEVERLYINLFTSLSNSPECSEARCLLLSFVTKRVSPAQITKIERVHMEEEIHSTLKKLPQYKALYLDGLTTEVISSCWSFTRKDYMEMIIHY